MRISDWSADVCSSDLRHADAGGTGGVRVSFSSPLAGKRVHYTAIALPLPVTPDKRASRERDPGPIAPPGAWPNHGSRLALPALAWPGVRKSVLEGKSVSVGVDLGGRRIIKNTN